MIKVSGTIIAILELGLFYLISHEIRDKYNDLEKINKVSYYWLMFTVLTGIWEWTYVRNRGKARRVALQLLKKKQHVWSKKYDLGLVFPWRLSRQFYAEYGAYADREYMRLKDDWSLVVEGSHAALCAFFAFMSIFSTAMGINLIEAIYISMAAQFTNSFMYMGEYFIQVSDPDSVNYNTKKFPCDMFLLKRPFMWINIFWLIMPTYVLLTI